MLNFPKTLQDSADFLSLTLAHEWAIPSFEYKVKSNTGVNIQVTVLDTGIILFEPDVNNTAYVGEAKLKHIVLSCGIHGNETAPIELCASLIKQLLLGQIALAHRVLFIIGNPAAINQNKRFVEENLNSLFSNTAKQKQAAVNFERKRAALLESAVLEFYQQSANAEHRYHYDLHTAIRASKHEKFAIYPFLHGQPWQQEQLTFLKFAGVNTVLFANAPTSTFSYFSSHQCHAKSFTIELGKAKPFGENNMADFEAMKKALMALLTNKTLTLAPFEQADFNLYEIHQRINKQSANFAFNFPETAANFTCFNPGELIAQDGELRYYAKHKGEAILFPNANVPIGQRALLTVKPYVFS